MSAQMGRPKKAETKAVMFSVRVKPETVAAIDREADHAGLSRSAWIERALLAATSQDADAEVRPDLHALAKMIVMQIEQMERTFGERWQDSPLVSLAIVDAVRLAIGRYGAVGEAKLSPQVVAAAEDLPPALAEQYKTPAGFGAIEGGKVISVIESMGMGVDGKPVDGSLLHALRRK